MDYEEEACKLFNKLKEKYTNADLISIAHRLLCMVLAIEIYESKYDSFQKNLIFKKLEQSIPNGIEGLLKLTSSP